MLDIAVAGLAMVAGCSRVRDIDVAEIPATLGTGDAKETRSGGDTHSPAFKTKAHATVRSRAPPWDTRWIDEAAGIIVQALVAPARNRLSVHEYILITRRSQLISCFGHFWV